MNRFAISKLAAKCAAKSILTALLLAIVLPAVSSAQNNIPLRIPEETLRVDLSPRNKERKVVLLEDGEAIEAPLVFTMIGRDAVTVTAELPLPGRFDVHLADTKAPVEVKDIMVEGRTARAEIVLKHKIDSPHEIAAKAARQIDELLPKAAKTKAEQEARKRKVDDLRAHLKRYGLDDPEDDEAVREKFVRVRALESQGDLLRRKMNEATRRHPRWYEAQQKQLWEKASAGTLYGFYETLLEMELCDEALTRAGMDADRSTRNAALNLKPMLGAVHFIVSGEALDEDQKEKARRAFEVLDTGGVEQLRAAVTVSLKCRLYSNAADGRDANAQWFNAQRVGCRAAGVSVIRVHGRLDPSAGDAVDWWILERFDPSSTVIETTKEAGVRFDPPMAAEGGARLRIAATGKDAVDYWFEFRSGDRQGGLKVTVHESPAAGNTKFPF
jgi:hypothetical protein